MQDPYLPARITCGLMETGDLVVIIITGEKADGKDPAPAFG
jgi:hypothetical protein